MISAKEGGRAQSRWLRCRLDARAPVHRFHPTPRCDRHERATAATPRRGGRHRTRRRRGVSIRRRRARRDDAMRRLEREPAASCDRRANGGPVLEGPAEPAGSPGACHRSPAQPTQPGVLGACLPHAAHRPRRHRDPRGRNTHHEPVTHPGRPHSLSQRRRARDSHRVLPRPRTVYVRVARAGCGPTQHARAVMGAPIPPHPRQPDTGATSRVVMGAPGSRCAHRSRRHRHREPGLGEPSRLRTGKIRPGHPGVADGRRSGCAPRASNARGQSGDHRRDRQSRRKGWEIARVGEAELRGDFDATITDIADSIAVRRAEVQRLAEAGLWPPTDSR